MEDWEQALVVQSISPAHAAAATALLGNAREAPKHELAWRRTTAHLGTKSETNGLESELGAKDEK